jgi:uroporphyrinogen decarboxylase
MTTPQVQPALLQVLSGQKTPRPPVWFMRQAGRYLPEYRALRAETPDFIAFCLNPEMAAEATLQPMKRFGFDAAIVFADILLIPRALGQDVWFETGEGPRLGEMPSVESHAPNWPRGPGDYLHQIGQTLSLVREAAGARTALIGFAGAPWTVATYMLDGHHNTIGKGERARRGPTPTKPEKVDALLEVLVEATARYF